MSPEGALGSSPEILVEDAERLASIQEIWLAMACEVNTTVPNTPARAVAQQKYAVSLMARIDWEREHGVEFDDTQIAHRLNVLFFEGLYQEAEERYGSVSAGMRMGYEGWSNYFRTEIYPAVQPGKTAPKNHYELLLQLYRHEARFLVAA